MSLKHIAQAQRMDKLSHLKPWSYQQFKQFLTPPNHAWVLQQNNQIIGFAMVRLILNEAELLNIVIDSPYQQQGLGKTLLTFICNWLQDIGATQLFLEVRRSNQQAINLYQQTGFHMLGTRKNYYPCKQGKEDALILSKDI